jgi:hypothetical protein
MNLASMQRTEGVQKGLLDGLWCYGPIAPGASETAEEELERAQSPTPLR